MTDVANSNPASTRRLLVLARDLLQAHDLKSILDLVGPALQELLGADWALLFAHLEGQELVTAFDRHGSVQPAKPDSLLYRQARQAMQAQTPVLLPHVETDPTIAAGSVPAVGVVSLVALPFPPIEAVGVLAALWRQPMAPAEQAQQLAVLRYLGELTGAALGNLDVRLTLEAQVAACSEVIARAAREYAQELQRRDRREAEFRRLSTIDVLTGLLNRRGFFLHAEQSFKVAQRQGLPSALVFADIDGLKGVNDGLGHDAGDRLIQDSAWIVRHSVRDSDVVARYGGDEFAAFTLDSAQPATILARIQENIDDFRRHSPRPYRVSFSTGIVKCNPAADLSLADYLASADKEMYIQKRGRSQ